MKVQFEHNGKTIEREINTRGALTEQKTFKFLRETINKDKEVGLLCVWGKVVVKFYEDKCLYAESELDCNVFGRTNVKTTMYKTPNSLMN